MQCHAEQNLKMKDFSLSWEGTRWLRTCLLSLTHGRVLSVVNKESCSSRQTLHLPSENMFDIFFANRTLFWAWSRLSALAASLRYEHAYLLLSNPSHHSRWTNDCITQDTNSKSVSCAPGTSMLRAAAGSSASPNRSFRQMAR